MRISIAIATLGLVCVALVTRGHAAEPAKASAAEASKADASSSPRRVGVETPAQTNALHTSRAKLDIAPGDPPAAAPAAGVLTFEQLTEMLDNMGYEPKVGNYTDGAKYITVVIPRGTWTFHITVDLSPNKAWVWMRANLGEWKAEHQANAPRLFKLLNLNFTHWPSYFMFVGGPTLYLDRPIANSGIKAAAVRTALEAFMTTIQSTQADWDTKTWTDAAPAATPVPAPAPAPAGGAAKATKK